MIADFHKIGLLILNEDGTKFLVCEKGEDGMTQDYLFPGGKIEEEDEFECIVREIWEELDCEVAVETLEFVGAYMGPAAGDPSRTVAIRLYKGEIVGKPTPSSEIKFIHWIGRDDINNERVSPIIRRQILPDLIERDILKQESE